MVHDNDTGRYLQNNGTFNSTYNQVADEPERTLNATSTNWTYALVLPGAGDYSVTAFAYDTCESAGPVHDGCDGALPLLPR